MARRQGHVEAVNGMEELLRKIRNTGEDAEWTSWQRYHTKECSQEQGLLKYKGKVYVGSELRSAVMKAHHDATDAGHPGQDKTLELITRNYWWPTIRQDVRQFVRKELKHSLHVPLVSWCQILYPHNLGRRSP